MATVSILEIVHVLTLANLSAPANDASEPPIVCLWSVLPTGLKSSTRLRGEGVSPSFIPSSTLHGQSSMHIIIMRRYRRDRGSIVSSNPSMTAPSIVRPTTDVGQSSVSYTIREHRGPCNSGILRRHWLKCTRLAGAILRTTSALKFRGTTGLGVFSRHLKGWKLAGAFV